MQSGVFYFLIGDDPLNQRHQRSIAAKIIERRLSRLLQIFKSKSKNNDW